MPVTDFHPVHSTWGTKDDNDILKWEKQGNAIIIGNWKVPTSTLGIQQTGVWWEMAVELPQAVSHPAVRVWMCHTVPRGTAKLLQLLATVRLSLPHQQLPASVWSSALASSAPCPSCPCLIAFKPAPLCSVPCHPLCKSWISSKRLQCDLIFFPVLPRPPF